MTNTKYQTSIQSTGLSFISIQYRGKTVKKQIENALYGPNKLHWDILRVTHDQYLWLMKIIS